MNNMEDLFEGEKRFTERMEFESKIERGSVPTSYIEEVSKMTGIKFDNIDLLEINIKRKDIREQMKTEIPRYLYVLNEHKSIFHKKGLFFERGIEKEVPVDRVRMFKDPISALNGWNIAEQLSDTPDTDELKRNLQEKGIDIEGLDKLENIDIDVNDYYFEFIKIDTSKIHDYLIVDPLTLLISNIAPDAIINEEFWYLDGIKKSNHETITIQVKATICDDIAIEVLSPVIINDDNSLDLEDIKEYTINLTDPFMHGDFFDITNDLNPFKENDYLSYKESFKKLRILDDGELVIYNPKLQSLFNKDLD